jgi:16S rRNA (guanine1207-N2)-methyltransferase
MSQYFDNDKAVKRVEKTISYYFNGVPFHLKSNNGIFSKNGLDFGSRVLMETVSSLNLTGDILDLGCGIGVIGLTLAYFDKNKYTLVDINQLACDVANINALNLSLEDRVSIKCSDGFAEINEKIFDFILLNPPIRAGKEVIYKLYKDSYDHLKRGGLLYIVVRKDQGALSHKKYLESIFQDVSLLNKDSGYYIYGCHKQ